MSWRNCELAFANVPQSLVTDFTWCDNPVENSNKVSYDGINPENVSIPTGYLIGDSNNGLNVTSDQYYYYFVIMYENQNIFDSSVWNAPKTNEYGTTTISYIACLNDETGQGIFHVIKRWRSEGDWNASIDPYTGIYSTENKQKAYRFLSANEVQPPVQTYTSNGGGATHIAKVIGQLKDLSSNLSDILIVSGGGGGGMLIGETEYAGADAGGIAGNSTNSANQTTGYTFGQGESSSNASGGGSGLYGGYKGIVV